MTGSPSSVLTTGLGAWGSSALVLTLGYGTEPASPYLCGEVRIIPSYDGLTRLSPSYDGDARFIPSYDGQTRIAECNC